MIDLETETLIGFAEAAKHLPRSPAGRPATQTAARWSLVGLHGVRLEAVRVGGRRYTSREACRWFVAALGRRFLDERITAQRTTPEAAKAELARRGYL